MNEVNSKRYQRLLATLAICIGVGISTLVFSIAKWYIGSAVSAAFIGLGYIMGMLLRMKSMEHQQQVQEKEKKVKSLDELYRSVDTAYRALKNQKKPHDFKKDLEYLAEHIFTDWSAEISDTGSSIDSHLEHMRNETETLSKGIDSLLDAARELYEKIIETNETKESSLLQEGRSGFKKQALILSREQKISRELIERYRELSGSISDLYELAADIAQISDKTRFLALNAAIEASRSGEAGKGFSVVADGVTNLSDLSAQASKRMSAKLADMSEKMNSVLEDTEAASKKNHNAANEAKEALDRIMVRFDTIEKLVFRLKEVFQRELQISGERLQRHHSHSIEALSLIKEIQEITRMMGDFQKKIASLSDESSVENFEKWLKQLSTGGQSRDAASEKSMQPA